MILHVYFARRFLWIFLAIFAVFLGFTMLLDMVEQLRRFEPGVVPFSEILRLTMLNTPEGMYQILPLVMILATVTLFLGLARSSELVVTRAAGRSALRALVAPVLVASLIGGIAVAMANPIVAATSKRYDELRAFYKSGSDAALSIGREGLWLRQGSERGQTVIRAARASPDALVLYTVSFVGYAPDGGPVRRIEAEAAQLVDGAWDLRNAVEWPLTPGVNPAEARVTHDRLTVPSTLTQERIIDSFGTPAAVSVWDLPAFIDQLEEAGFSARRHAVWMQMELARPLFLVAMVLVGAAFTMRHTRFGGTGLAVLGAVLMGFGLYYIRNFAQILGENGQIPTLMAAWTPPVASVLLALGLLLHMEDG